MAKYKSEGKVKSVWEYFEHTCSLGHKHDIRVLYNFDKKEFVVDKEQHLSLEERTEIEKVLLKYCDWGCFYCEQPLKRSDLAGLIVDYREYYKVKKSVCSNCLEKKEWLAWDESFITLDYYLEMLDYIGKEELKDCKDLVGYPKIIKALKDYSVLDNNPELKPFDLEMIAKFRQEVDLEWERDPGDMEELEKPSPEERLKVVLDRGQCQHEWYNSSASRQRCKKCYLLKEKKAV